MSEFSEAINTLELQVNLLIAKKLEIEKELGDSRLKVEELTTAFASQKSEIERLTEKNKILRIANGNGSDNEQKREIKLKINEIVREVDKCIAQLNQ